MRQQLLSDRQNFEEVTSAAAAMRLREPEIGTLVASLRHGGAADSQSILSDTTFVFDDAVINSRAYREVLARHQRGLDQQASSSQRRGMLQGDYSPELMLNL